RTTATAARISSSRRGKNCSQWERASRTASLGSTSAQLLSAAMLCSTAAWDVSTGVLGWTASMSDMLTFLAVPELAGPAPIRENGAFLLLNRVVAPPPGRYSANSGSSPQGLPDQQVAGSGAKR